VAARNNLGIALAAQGRHAEAEVEFRSILAVHECVLAPKHAVTLRTRQAFADELAANGDYAEAEAEFRAIFDGQQQMLGAEHLDTLNTRARLVSVLLDCGNYEDAEAESKAILATCSEAQGTPRAALDNDRHLLAVSPLGMPPKHNWLACALAHAVSVRRRLAESIAAQGKYGEAEAERRAIPVAESNEWQSFSHDFLANLALELERRAALADQSEHRDEEQELRAVFGFAERVLGAGRPAALEVHQALAAALRTQNKLAEVVAEYRAVAAVCERVFGARHYDTLTNRYNLAVALHEQGSRAEADAEHRAVLSICSQAAEEYWRLFRDKQHAGAVAGLQVWHGEEEQGVVEGLQPCKARATALPAAQSWHPSPVWLKPPSRPMALARNPRLARVRPGLAKAVPVLTELGWIEAA